MPTYQYECSECGDRRQQIFKINEFEEFSLRDMDCVQDLEGSMDDGEMCTGTYETTFERPPSFSFKGGAPTPKFHRKGNQG